MMFICEVMENGKVPVKSTPESAGYDLFTSENREAKCGEVVKIALGVKIKLEKGKCGLVLGRSSLALKKIKIHTGLLDSDYDGILCLIADNQSEEKFTWSKGDRLGQLLILSCETDHLVEGKVPPSVHGGFGSTGK